MRGTKVKLLRKVSAASNINFRKIKKLYNRSNKNLKRKLSDYAKYTIEVYEETA